ncbi:MAG: metallophosphoesterase, partial [Candidatus Marinimicrobia bacterium]|nr:metallophosphoesterase [Candidatus Neomarinimicrobiota bacterium]
DVHLGGERSNYKDFWDFLERVNKLNVNGISLECNGNEIKIKKPGTIVLLGDILELWDPRKDDRNYVIKDVLTPISILNDLDCDIIYVIGNHDEDLYDIKKVWGKEGVRFPYKGKGTFKIFYRTYPERIKGTNRVEGIKIGENRYAFIHGHQFDKWQICHRISRFLSKHLKEEYRFDPIDWLQDLANVSYTKKIRMKLGGWLTGIFTGLLFAIYLLGYYFLFFKLQPFNKMLIGSGWGAFWVFISFLFLVTVLPVCLTFWFTKFWGVVLRIKKCTPVDEVVKSRYRHEKGKHIKADIVVFGHTHLFGWHLMKDPVKNEDRLFINTGGWVRECEEEGGIPNTFLYIDTAAPYLLKWDKGKITCLKDFREVLS